MVRIKGIQKTSLIDYPGKMSAILFTAGCNMRCPFCQNPDLIHKTEELPDIPEDEIIEFLKDRKKWLDGICISGGEPLLHHDTPKLMQKIKDIGLLVKLDTNGLNPKLLKEIIDAKLVDYIAMDIKSDLDNYHLSSGGAIDLTKIKESISLIMNSGIDYEFRSTVVPDFFDEKIVENIGMMVKGAKKFYLQQFRSTVPLLDKSFEGKTPYEGEVLDKFKEILENSVESVEVRK